MNDIMTQDFQFIILYLIFFHCIKYIVLTDVALALSYLIEYILI